MSTVHNSDASNDNNHPTESASIQHVPADPTTTPASLQLNKLGRQCPRTFLIENVIAEGTVNLVVGATGSGKTTFVLQELISNYIAGRKVLGKNIAKQVRPFYVSLDRDKGSFLHLLWRLSIPEDLFPWECLPGSTLDVSDIQNRVTKHDAKHIIVDGIEHCPPANQMTGFPTAASVRLWLGILSKVAYSSKFTVTGIMQMGKERPGQQITEDRHAGIGSVYWGAGTETIIKIARQQDESRLVTVASHMGPKLTLEYVFNKDGELVVAESLEEVTEQLALARALEPGHVYTKPQLIKAVVDGEVCRKTKAYDRLYVWRIKGWIEAEDSNHFQLGQSLYKYAENAETL
jgi:hypothetical protein